MLKAAGFNPKSEIIALAKRGELEINLKENGTSMLKKIDGIPRRVIGLTFLSKRNNLNSSNNFSDPNDVPPESIPF